LAAIQRMPVCATAFSGLLRLHTKADAQEQNDETAVWQPNSDDKARPDWLSYPAARCRNNS
jgi:hypothetical protein